MSINDNGVTGTDISTFLTTIQSSTSIPKGHVRISSKADSNEFILWQITEVYDRPSAGGTWWELEVVPVAFTETVTNVTPLYAPVCVRPKEHSFITVLHHDFDT